MDALRTVVLGVIREAMRERGLSALVVLRPGTDGHDLVMEWTSGLDATAADRAPADRAALVLDPAAKEVLLLEGPMPGAELLPLGDVWGSQVSARDAAGARTPLERALADAFESAAGLGALEAHLSADEAAEVRRRLLRAAPLLRPPLVPKLTEWTPGIDPGP